MSRQDTSAYSKARRAESFDPKAPKRGLGKQARIDLGLALLSTLRQPGATFTLHEIAIWCGCTDGGIYMLEKRILKKVANALRFQAGRQACIELDRFTPPKATAAR